MPVWQNDILHPQYEREIAEWWIRNKASTKNLDMLISCPGAISGPIIVDTSGYERHLTNNGVTAVTASNPHHLDFNGTSYATRANDAGLDQMANGWTFGGWIKTSGSATFDVLFSKGPNLYNPTPKLWLGLSDTNTLHLNSNDDEASIQNDWIGGTAVPLNQWVFIAGGIRADEQAGYGTYFFTINTQYVEIRLNTDIVGDPLVIYSPNTDPIRIGATSNNQNPYTGKIAECFLAATGFSQSDLTGIYQRQAPRFI